jgi:hypothetical protein
LAKNPDYTHHPVNEGYRLFTTVGTPNARGGGKLAAILGFVLFFAIYGCFKLLRRSLYGEGSSQSQWLLSNLDFTH